MLKLVTGKNASEFCGIRHISIVVNDKSYQTSGVHKGDPCLGLPTPGPPALRSLILSLLTEQQDFIPRFETAEFPEPKTQRILQFINTLKHLPIQVTFTASNSDLRFNP